MPNGDGKVIEKSCKRKRKKPIVMEFGDQFWNSINFVSEFYQVCNFCYYIKKFIINLKSLRFPTISAKMSRMKNLSTETVMENQVTVIEKSRKKNFQSVATL